MNPQRTAKKARLERSEFRYGSDGAGNLSFRTNNALLQNFSVNSLNELTNVSRSGTLTVAGTATERPASLSHPTGVTGVTVSGTGLASGSATVYDDATWAIAGAIPADGNNSYTATGTDTLGRTSTSTVSAFLPASATNSFDLNGNLVSDGNRCFAYDDENQLVSVWVTNAWRSGVPTKTLRSKGMQKISVTAPDELAVVESRPRGFHECSDTTSDT